MARIAWVRAGLDAELALRTAAWLGLDAAAVRTAVGVTRATIMRGARSGGRLGLAASERLLFLLDLRDDVARMLTESGGGSTRAGFDPGGWLGAWLRTAHCALGGIPPITLSDTADGRDLVRALLNAQQSGAYW
jgi:hypothetical protein